MKKSIKVISTLLLTIMLVASIAGTVLAVDPNTVLNGLNGNGNVQTNDLTKVGNNIVTIIQVVGIVIAVIVLLVIGIKYMMLIYMNTMIIVALSAVFFFELG